MRFLFIILLTGFSLFPLGAQARSGCCSWHGGVAYCDTSVGTYVCNDGSYSPSCGCAYYPPAPVCPQASLGNKGSWTFTSNGCNQDINFSWDKGNNDEFYSLAISKVRGADPGPKADTTTTNFTFKNVKPGKWYINVKPGRSCGWGSTYNWTVDVPDVKPQISFYESVISDSERKLNYSVSCAQKVEINNKIGVLKNKSGAVTIHPTTDISYTLSAINNKTSDSASVFIKYPLSKNSEETTTFVQAKDANKVDVPQTPDNPNNTLLYLLYAIGVGGVIWAVRKVQS